MLKDRWPPVYDATELRAAISAIASGAEPIDKVLYASSTADGGAICQGDVIQLTAAIPGIDEAGEAAEIGSSELWLVVGNTCDFDRPIDDVPWTQVAPIAHAVGLSPQRRQSLRQYEPTRAFFLPELDGNEYVADLTRMVAAHKRALTERATVKARLSRRGWMLLHACIVRFLARDDGRFDT